MSRDARRIGFLVFDGVTALDLVGPAEAFAVAGPDTPRPPYEVVVIGLGRRPSVAESGLLIQPSFTVADAPPLDTLIVPGGAGLRQPDTNRAVSDWLRRRARRIRRIAAVCTGIYGLAPSGLLDGRRVTTHWRFTGDLARRFPALHVEPDALYVKDGRFYTSAGVTAGIDLSLSLIEEDLGPAAALSVARELVVYLKRPGGQEQFSEPLRFQVAARDRLGDLAAWIAAHLDADLSVDALAKRAALSPRQLGRCMQRALQCSPAAFVQRLRLDEARRRLSAPASRVEHVAASVGFGSADVFTRAFERRFGIAPSAYRARFSVGSSSR